MREPQGRRPPSLRRRKLRKLRCLPSFWHRCRAWSRPPKRKAPSRAPSRSMRSAQRCAMRLIKACRCGTTATPLAAPASTWPWESALRTWIRDWRPRSSCAPTGAARAVHATRRAGPCATRWTPCSAVFRLAAAAAPSCRSPSSSARRPRPPRPSSSTCRSRWPPCGSTWSSSRISPYRMAHPCQPTSGSRRSGRSGTRARPCGPMAPCSSSQRACCLGPRRPSRSPRPARARPLRSPRCSTLTGSRPMATSACTSSRMQPGRPSSATCSGASSP